MEIRGVHFAPIFIASGAAGFFDPKEYWYHRLGSPWKIAGLTFARAGITAKTMTLLPTKGNLPMQSDGVTPKEWMPKCMVVNSLKQVVLNSVGLSNRGAPDLLARNIWQQRTGGPFRLSFMAPFRENETTQDRLDQYQELTQILLKERTHTWRSEIGLEVISHARTLTETLLILEMKQGKFLISRVLLTYRLCAKSVQWNQYKL